MSYNKIGRINDDIQRVLSKLLTEVKDPRVQQGMISELDIKHDEDEDNEL